MQKSDQAVETVKREDTNETNTKPEQHKSRHRTSYQSPTKVQAQQTAPPRQKGRFVVTGSRIIVSHLFDVGMPRENTTHADRRPMNRPQEYFRPRRAASIHGTCQRKMSGKDKYNNSMVERWRGEGVGRGPNQLYLLQMHPWEPQVEAERWCDSI